MNSIDSQPMIAGKSVTIRPVRITDAGMEADFGRRLSPQSRHYRFLGGVKELSPTDLQRYCDIDGLHTMAFVATIQEDGHDTQIGVSRYAPNSEQDAREIAVTVADEWQHKGLGALLMKKLIESARDHGVRKLYSVDFADNAAMRELAGELGMSVTRDPDDAHQVIYSLTV